MMILGKQLWKPSFSYRAVASLAPLKVTASTPSAKRSANALEHSVMAAFCLRYSRRVETNSSEAARPFRIRCCRRHRCTTDLCHIDADPPRLYPFIVMLSINHRPAMQGSVYYVYPHRKFFSGLYRPTYNSCVFGRNVRLKLLRPQKHSRLWVGCFR